MTAVSATASAFRSQAATEHPCAVSCRASSRPMPEPPPVTTASFPVNESTAPAHLPLFPLVRPDYLPEPRSPSVPASAGHRHFTVQRTDTRRQGLDRPRWLGSGTRRRIPGSTPEV